MGNIDAVGIDVAIYCNKVTATKLLQQNHWIKAVTTKPLQSDVTTFSYLQLCPICISCEFKQFNFSLVIF